MKRNKFGVPYRRFVLRLADGRAVAMDSGCEEDWGNVQQCLPGDWPDWKTAVGWGNEGNSPAASQGIMMRRRKGF